MTAAAPLAFVFVSMRAPRFVLVTVSTRLLSNLRPLTPLTTLCVPLTWLVGNSGRGASPVGCRDRRRRDRWCRDRCRGAVRGRSRGRAICCVIRFARPARLACVGPVPPVPPVEDRARWGRRALLLAFSMHPSTSSNFTMSSLRALKLL